MYWVEQPDGRFMVHADNSLTPLSAEELEKAGKANEPITINIIRVSGEALTELTASRCDRVSNLLQQLAETRCSKMTLLLGEESLSASAILGDLDFTDSPTLYVVEEPLQVRQGSYHASQGGAFSVARHHLILWEDGKCVGVYEGGDEFENWWRFEAGGSWVLGGKMVTFTWQAPQSRSTLIHSGKDTTKRPTLSSCSARGLSRSEYSTAEITDNGTTLRWHNTTLKWTREPPASHSLKPCLHLQFGLPRSGRFKNTSWFARERLRISLLKFGIDARKFPNQTCSERVLVDI